MGHDELPHGWQYSLRQQGYLTCTQDHVRGMAWRLRLTHWTPFEANVGRPTGVRLGSVEVVGIKASPQCNLGSPHHVTAHPLQIPTQLGSREPQKRPRNASCGQDHFGASSQNPFRGTYRGAPLTDASELSMTYQPTHPVRTCIHGVWTLDPIPH